MKEAFESLIFLFNNLYHIELIYALGGIFILGIFIFYFIKATSGRGKIRIDDDSNKKYISIIMNELGFKTTTTFFPIARVLYTKIIISEKEIMFHGLGGRLWRMKKILLKNIEIVDIDSPKEDLKIVNLKIGSIYFRFLDKRLVLKISSNQECFLETLRLLKKEMVPLSEKAKKYISENS